MRRYAPFGAATEGGVRAAAAADSTRSVHAIHDAYRHGARLGSGRAGLAGCLGGLPFGGAVGDQAGDGGAGFVEVFAASEVALEGPPLLVPGVGVLDADPF